MKLDVVDKDGARIVRVGEERLDAAVAIDFKDRMREITHDWRGPVILDLERVQFLDSSGLGAVVAAMKLLDGQGTLMLTGLQPVVSKVFTLTRMDSVFDIHATVADARAAVRASQAA